MVKAPETEDFNRRVKRMKARAYLPCIGMSTAMQETAPMITWNKIMGFLPTMSIKKAFAEKKL